MAGTQHQAADREPADRERAQRQGPDGDGPDGQRPGRGKSRIGDPDGLPGDARGSGSGPRDS